MTTKIGSQGGADYLNGVFQTGWIPGEQEDLSSLTLKKPVTVEYVAANQIKIVGLDWSDRIQKGTRFRFKQGGDFKYFECTAVSVNADTLVTVDGHGTYTVENATIIDFWFSNSINPFGWPEYLGLADIGGWTSGLTAVYASATSITIAGIDVTDRIQQGTKIRYKQGGEYKYDFVSEVSFATDSTLTLMGGSTVEEETITDFAYSNIANPIGWPFGVDYIEGSNENGSWTKWTNGKMEVDGTASYSTIEVTSTALNIFSNNTTLQILFAAPFYEKPRVCILGVQEADSFLWIRTGEAPLTNQYTQGFRLCSASSQTVNNLVISYHAIGRWKE